MLISLQKQNFKEIIQKMSGVNGWNILELDDLLALKSPVATPLVFKVLHNFHEFNFNNK